jgi:hypothetical protein
MKGGSFYEGSWMEGERVEGRWVAADKRSEYSGQWKGAVKHGQGTFLVEGVFQYTGRGGPFLPMQAHLLRINTMTMTSEVALSQNANCRIRGTMA